MRIIIHCDDPKDMTLAMRSVKTSIREEYVSCAYTYGEAHVFVYANKTGWTVRVQHEKAEAE